MQHSSKHKALLCLSRDIGALQYWPLRVFPRQGILPSRGMTRSSRTRFNGVQLVGHDIEAI